MSFYFYFQSQEDMTWRIFIKLFYKFSIYYTDKDNKMEYLSTPQNIFWVWSFLNDRIYEQNELGMNSQKISHHHTLGLYKFLLVTQNEKHFVFFEDQT